MRQTNWDTSISAPDVSEVKIGNLCSIFGGPSQLFDLFSPPSLAVDIDAIVEFDELPRGVHKVKCDFLSISESRIHVPHPNFHDLALKLNDIAFKIHDVALKLNDFALRNRS